MCIRDSPKTGQTISSCSGCVRGGPRPRDCGRPGHTTLAHRDRRLPILNSSAADRSRGVARSQDSHCHEGVKAHPHRPHCVLNRAPAPSLVVFSAASASPKVASGPRVVVPRKILCAHPKKRPHAHHHARSITAQMTAHPNTFAPSVFRHFTVTSVSLPPFVSRRGLSNTNQRLSLSFFVFLCLSVCEASRLRSPPFTHSVYVATRSFR